ncbi:fasciclin domain-containing protein [Sphingobacterium hungaricum]|uniref:Fasciclin domain-containing protein n=1 Tax=Sphingobacterium hungaricum TaxID=2082723 RepID=A0A928USZ9_9SPHI|nr:fasciclin domain-containing protein [Sphingobacterium hungaricum]MBE8712268.1 hypothetical protein [Sphingobacterium hungaricum]
MKKIIFNSKKILFLGLSIFALLASCAKDDYYIDGGLANPHFDGTMLEYFDSKPRQFDTIAQIIRLAEMEEIFSTGDITFFAPSDDCIKRFIGTINTDGLNRDLYNSLLDTIVNLSDVSPEIWQAYLTPLIFKSKKLLADYPQVDFNLLNVHGGQNYISEWQTVSNIGVVFNDAVSADGKSVLKYLGYRQLNFTPFYANSATIDNNNTIPVASSDIQPTNGAVHVLDYTRRDRTIRLTYEIRQLIFDSKR